MQIISDFDSPRNPFRTPARGHSLDNPPPYASDRGSERSLDSDETLSIFPNGSDTKANPPYESYNGIPAQSYSFSPTEIPTAGRPLLYRNRILVYPLGRRMKCRKCANTGYKRYNPSRRCRRCWRRFGKPYEGLFKDKIVWKGPDSDELTITGHYMLQRPLPSGWNKPTRRMSCCQWAGIRKSAFGDMNRKLAPHLRALAEEKKALKAQTDKEKKGRSRCCCRRR